MASIINRGKGHRAIQFENPNGDRKTFGLGKCPMRDAETIRNHIEEILVGKLSGRAVPKETAEWIGNLPTKFSKKLAALGLISVPERKESSQLTIAAFVDCYITKREADTKVATRVVYKRTRKHLVEFFGDSKLLSEVTTGDAVDFRRYLIGEGLAENTVRRTCGFARQFFGDAVERKILGQNPFVSKSISVAVRGNEGRFRFISPEEAEKVLKACPDAGTRLIFALARYGGLRTPSETLKLRWSDINWEEGKMRVRSPKTEHHDGKASRIVPIFANSGRTCRQRRQKRPKAWNSSLRAYGMPRKTFGLGLPRSLNALAWFLGRNYSTT